MYSVNQVAEMMDRSPSHVWKLVKKGRIYSFGRPIRIKRAAPFFYLSKDPSAASNFRSYEFGIKVRV